MRWTVLAALTSLPFTSVLILPPEELRSPVPGMSMGRFLYCMNDADKPKVAKSNNIDVPSPLKDKPPPRTNFDWQCSGDLGWW
jgi:hypothetical protein